MGQQYKREFYILWLVILVLTLSATLGSLLRLWVCQMPFTIRMHNPHAKDPFHSATLYQ